MTQTRSVKRAIGIIFLLLLSGILYAGLKPFHSPANDVSWVANINALRFGDHATILGWSSLSPAISRAGGRSLEIWLQPGAAEDSNTFLAFYDAGRPRQLSFHQTESDLELRIETSAAWHSEQTAKLYVDSAFHDRKCAFWTVTAGPVTTAVFRDGVKVRESGKLPRVSKMFSGQLVIGNSPIFNDSWSGVLRGIAIYDRSLTPEQIARHYRTWTTKTNPDLSPEDACIALYLFDEHAGRIVHNKVGPGNDLYIPAKYLVLNQTVLDPVWRAFNWSWGFWKDALINFGGFIPVGYFCCAYFCVNGFARPTLFSSAVCGALSLFIELVQSRLPTRDSSMSDLLTNVAGSVIGAGLYSGRTARLTNRCIAWTIAIAEKT